MVFLQCQNARFKKILDLIIHFIVIFKESKYRHTKTEKDKWKGKNTDQKTDRHKDIQSKKQTDSLMQPYIIHLYKIHLNTDTHRQIQTHRAEEIQTKQTDRQFIVYLYVLQSTFLCKNIKFRGN